MTAQLEIDVRGLLAHCEKLANEDVKDWRLKKYIKSLATMIQELEEQLDRPPDTHIDDFRSRFEGLKIKAKYVEAEPGLGLGRLRGKLKKDYTPSGAEVFKEINQIHQSKYTTALRSALLGNDADDMLSSIRQRKGADAGSGPVSLPDGGSGAAGGPQVKDHEAIQDMIAENMLMMTKNLKDLTQTANKIVKKDMDTLQTSSKMTDKNMGALKKESEKLEDHSKRAWKCWMWLMIGFVMAIFIFMVMFMKMMKKKQ